MNRILPAIQVLCLLFISVAFGYYFFHDLEAIKEEAQGPSSISVKHKLQFSFASGFYTEAIALKITNPKDDSCTIFYSLDHHIPDDSSLKYGSPIYLDFSSNVSDETAHPQHRATLVRAIAYRNGKPISHVRTGVFFIDSMIFLKYPYPILSLVTEPDFPAGVDTIEISTHITLVENNGVVGLSQDAGLRILEKQLLQPGLGLLELISRKKYGTRYFNYPIHKQINAPKFPRFGLRKLPNNLLNVIVEGKDVVKIDTAIASPYVVYINERLEGIYISEPLTSDSVATYSD
ncbi:MAG TPA: hypothetical protein EYN38_05320 [Flavobacteriales bacterium]|nr:hypothetical protein [Flavobacteriales bacterium]HIO72509.1 hypothetical protein [Flavobacteriales bacterium]